MSRLAIRLLGPVQITLDGQPVTRFETEKDKALLVYLAAEWERPHRREYLAEMLWPDRPRGAAAANLRHALYVLRKVTEDRRRQSDPGSSPPFLLADRQCIQINTSADVWVDAQEFQYRMQEAVALDNTPLECLEQAAGLYRGVFLEDFSLRDSNIFHEWLLIKREHYNRMALRVLKRLAKSFEIWGQFDQALKFARRQAELAPWDETSHIQVMRFLAFTGKQGEALAYYERCCDLLEEDIGVGPGEAMTDIRRQIRENTLSIPSVSKTFLRRPQYDFRKPEFMIEGSEKGKPVVFVLRERELARLNDFLLAMLEGQTNLAFVVGGPGCGKTALLNEFTRRAMEKHPLLLIANGNCNAYDRLGDPYLPFRDIMAMITGDVEARWSAGTITGEHARRLWNACPLAIQSVIEKGSALIDTIINGDDLLFRAASVQPSHSEWLEQLSKHVEQRRAGRMLLDQYFLFEQITDVLRILAKKHPIVLLLDDLQWLDSASAALLFHLGRRLTGSKVLLVCAYRPEEVSTLPESGSDSLANILNEFKRAHGDIWLNLDHIDEAENREFIDAYLDTEPNRLGKRFRAALFDITQGHPLFTVEMLRAMRERGDIVRHLDIESGWVEGPGLNWETLPARVEAVIEQRVNRLNPELQEMLQVASVEGEVFTVQVLSRLTNMSERELLQQLSGDLEIHHRLVIQHQEVPTDNGRLYLYKFSHILIRNFLYGRLSQPVQQLLHRKIASALDELYGDRKDQVAVQLAHHYYRGRDPDRALQYLVLAAQIATRRYAYNEAIAYYAQAVELSGQASDSTISIARLHLERGKILETAGDFEQSRLAFESAIVKASAEDDRHTRWLTLVALGRLWGSRDYEQAREYFMQALDLAHEQTDPAVLAESLNWIGNWYLNKADPPKAVAYHLQALRICENLGDKRDLANTLDLLGISCQIGSDLKASIGYYDRAIALYRELNDRPRLASSLTGRGTIGSASAMNRIGIPVIKPREAQKDLDEAIQITREINSPAGTAWALWSSSLLQIVRGNFEKALADAHDALSISTKIGHREWVAGSKHALGSVFCALFVPEKAERILLEALWLGEELGSRHWINVTTARLVDVQFLLNNLSGVQRYLAKVIDSQTPMDSVGKRSCWARQAELALSLGDPILALNIVDRLIATAPGMAPDTVISYLWKLRGEALLALGYLEQAHSLLIAAIHSAQLMGERHLIWHLHGKLGNIYQRMDRQAEAGIQYSIARECIKELAASIKEGALRENYLQKATRSLGEERHDLS